MKAIFRLVTIFLILYLPNYAFAASPSFDIRPGSGKVIVNKNFTVDILIDSAAKSISMARAVIKYNPAYVTVVKAQRNESLFCSYPADEQSVDNENGILMVTGFCQSGVGSPYKTSGSADVFARVTFRAQKIGTATLSWAYTGEDIPFNSVMMKDGSPPANILTEKPSSTSFTVVKSTTTPQPKPTPTPDDSGNTPNTGMAISFVMLGAGILLLSLGFLYSKWADNRGKSKLRTVVTYGNKS